MRAKDIHMAAVIDPEERVVYLTGAIDRNDTRICMEVDLPEAGEWRLIKAETNLTTDSWTNWLISMGEGMRINEESSSPLISRQFKGSVYYDDLNSLCFFDGAVRPGEPVMKVMDFVTEVPRILASHNRSGGGGHETIGTLTPSMGPRELRKAFEQQLEIAARKPVIDIKAAAYVLPKGSSAYKLVA